MFVQNSIHSAWFVCRCYARALKLMSEVPSLWHDLGLNYYHQSCLPCLSEGDQNVTCLLLVKAQEVRQNLTHQFMLCLILELNLFISFSPWYVSV